MLYSSFSRTFDVPCLLKPVPLASTESPHTLNTLSAYASEAGIDTRSSAKCVEDG